MKVDFKKVLLNENGDKAILDPTAKEPKEFDVKTAVRIALNSQYDNSDIPRKILQGDLIARINSGVVDFEISDISIMIECCKKAWAPYYVSQLVTILNKSK